MKWWWPFVGIEILLAVSGISAGLAVYLYITGEPAMKIAICTFVAVFLFGSAIYNMIDMIADLRK